MAITSDTADTVPIAHVLPVLYNITSLICHVHFTLCPIYTADALFAVYEASSLELWYFMCQAAISGGARTSGHIALFYVTLVFFLVFLVQVSIYTCNCMWFEQQSKTHWGLRVPSTNFV